MYMLYGSKRLLLYPSAAISLLISGLALWLWSHGHLFSETAIALTNSTLFVHSLVVVLVIRKHPQLSHLYLLTKRSGNSDRFGQLLAFILFCFFLCGIIVPFGGKRHDEADTIALCVAYIVSVLVLSPTIVLFYVAKARDRPK
jgi:hypothetical protein